MAFWADAGAGLSPRRQNSPSLSGRLPDRNAPGTGRRVLALRPHAARLLVIMISTAASQGRYTAGTERPPAGAFDSVPRSPAFCSPLSPFPCPRCPKVQKKPASWCAVSAAWRFTGFRPSGCPCPFCLLAGLPAISPAAGFPVSDSCRFPVCRSAVCLRRLPLHRFPARCLLQPGSGTAGCAAFVTLSQVPAGGRPPDFSVSVRGRRVSRKWAWMSGV